MPVAAQPREPETEGAVKAARVRPNRPLAAVAGALVCYGALCKVLLFRNLEYTGSDLYGLLDQSRSWLYTGRLLQDNAYGNQAAIHNYYLLPVLSPLTLWLGAYGLILALALLELLAVARLVTSRALDTPGRLAALVGLVSPLGFFALDDPHWGFHPELLYPSLAVLLALALLEHRHGQAALAAVAIVLVKEDGALVCGGVLAAYYLHRLWLARSAPGAERRRILFRAAGALAATAIVFALGLFLLWWVGRGAPVDQSTAGERLSRAWGILIRTVRPGGSEARRAAFLELLVGYAGVAALLLLPLGARIARGLLLLLMSAPPIMAVLVVSDAHYKFLDPLWAQRVATIMATVLACVIVAGASAGADARTPRLAWSVGSVLSLGALSWSLQLFLLARFDYSLRDRIDVRALWSGRGSALSTLTSQEVRLWRCVGARLPTGTPVSPVAEILPFFHRQSIVFQGLEDRASRRPRLRVFRMPTGAAAAPSPAGTASSPAGSCPGPRVRDLVSNVDCELQPLLSPCGWKASAPLQGGR